MTTVMDRTGTTDHPPEGHSGNGQASHPPDLGGRDTAVVGGPPQAAWKGECAGSVILTVVGLGSAVVATTLQDRGIQVPVFRTLAVVVLAFIPGWLYIRFTGYRAAAVWDEYVLNLHRLRVDDPGNLPEPLENSTYHPAWVRCGGVESCDTPNIYRRKFEAYYGKGTARTRSAEPPDFQGRVDTLFPILLTTVILAVGWAAVLLGWRYDAHQATLSDALRFGFMGAYSFVLQMLVRRFFQSDLRPSAYVSASVRVVTVCILVAVTYQVTAGAEAGTQAALAFLIGFFPLVGMQALQRVVAKILKYPVKSLDVPYPLSDLDGLNVWNEARLLEEGIEDMQNLTTANLVDVMLHTRVPLGRLVDWLDQAHLYLHLERCRCRNAEDRRTCGRETLRRYGIRSATDLEDVFRRDEPCPLNGEAGVVRTPDEENDVLVQALRWVLDEPVAPDATAVTPKRPSATQAILKTFESEPNLAHVRNWKRSWQPAGQPA